MIVTRVAYSKGLTGRKFAELSELARRLGRLRHELWDRYGSVSGYDAKHRDIRDAWLREGREFDVPARLWKETLRDVMDDIQARKAAGFRAVARKLYRRYGGVEGKALAQRLRDGTWQAHPVIHRYVRNEMPRGRSWVDNQIVLDSQCYKHFLHGGKGWIEVMGLLPRKRIALPLGTTHPIRGTIRLILRDGRVEVHYAVQVEERQKNPDGIKIGVDKGYTEVFADSEGEFHGPGLGAKLSAESDFLKLKYARRNKLRAIAEKKAAKKPHKAARIQKHNLGRQKLGRRKSKHVQTIKTIVHEAAHGVAQKASIIVHEDLKVPMKSRKQRGKNTNRRLAGWVRGMIQEALESVSQRYGVPLRAVNAAYTSQGDSRYRCALLGQRVGDSFYCFDGVVLRADVNAARNVRDRDEDTEIPLWMKAEQVKSILLERARRVAETVQPGLQLQG